MQMIRSPKFSVFIVDHIFLREKGIREFSAVVRTQKANELRDDHRQDDRAADSGGGEEKTSLKHTRDQLEPKQFCIDISTHISGREVVF